MIILFANRGYCFTHEPLKQQRDFGFRIWPYDRLFRARHLPAATYIFSDLDRLHWWDLELAARAADHLRQAGMRVLNDPARVRQRYHLLTRLYREGINDFTVWHAGERPPPEAWPVFLRTDSAHRGPLTDLLYTPDALERAEQRLLEQGIPESELLIVQYRAEPLDGRLFRKLATFRVGDALVPALCTHQGDWQAKRGQSGIAGQAWYEDEYRIVNESRYADTLWAAFTAGSIEYGRADYGVVAGRPAIYEINTNPMVRTLLEHPYPIRLESAAAFMSNLKDAFRRIDGPASGRRVRMPFRRSLGTRLADIRKCGQFRRTPPMP